MAKSFLTNEAPHVRHKRITSHAIAKGNGFYVSKVPVGWTIYIADPVAAKKLLMKSDNFPKSHRKMDTLGENSISVQFLGRDHIVISNDEMWKKQRKIMNPLFHRLMPVKTMASVTSRLFSVIEKDIENVPITKLMQDYSLDILGLTIFDFDFQALNGDPENWTSTYKMVTESLLDPVSDVLGSLEKIVSYINPTRKRSTEAVIKLNNKFEQLAKDKREKIKNGILSTKPDSEKDILTLMLEGERDGTTALSGDELRHNIAIFFLAGHDTTANSLAFCLYHIAKDKRVQKKMRREILAILGDSNKDVEPTLEELKQMVYMDLVIKENLRMNGLFDLLLPRRVKEDINLVGTVIPKGVNVAIDASAIHRDKKNWKYPNAFLPERFEDDGEQNEGLTWIPFSNGTRKCIGMNFSLTEQKLALAMLLRKYEVDISKDSVHYDDIVYDRPTYVTPLSLELKFEKRY